MGQVFDPTVCRSFYCCQKCNFALIILLILLSCTFSVICKEFHRFTAKLILHMIISALTWLFFYWLKKLKLKDSFDTI